MRVQKEYRVQPWVAHRTFSPKGDVPRTVLSNELDHEFLELEGPAAQVWQLLAEQGVCTAASIAQSLCEPVEGVLSLLDDLTHANLIDLAIPARDALCNSTSGANQSSQTSERYHHGSYTEPVPGGSNLEAELEFQDWALSHRFLWSASWEITYRCNESCVHCFNPGASHAEGQRAKRKTDELSRDEWTRLLDEMSQVGVFRLLLTGGEVALRKDFFDIVGAARQRGFSVTVFTNGTLFNEAEVERLAGLYPHRVELSLYSSDPEVHDRITRLPGSFEKTRLTAQRLASLGVTVAVKMAVMADTIHAVSAFRSMCDLWGLESQVDFNMSPGVDGARAPLLTLLPDSLALIKAAMTPGDPLFAGEVGQPRRSSWDDRKSSPVCGAGRSLMSISPEGHIYPCNSLPLHVGSVRGQGLASVWNQSALGGAFRTPPEASILSKWQSVNGGDYHVCGDFARCAWCQKCPGMAFLESGDELGPSTTNCRNAAARMIAYELIAEGRSPDSIGMVDLPILRHRFPHNIPLWDPAASVAARISVESLRTELKARAKVTVLQ